MAQLHSSDEAFQTLRCTETLADASVPTPRESPTVMPFDLDDPEAQRFRARTDGFSSEDDEVAFFMQPAAHIGYMEPIPIVNLFAASPVFLTSASPPSPSSSPSSIQHPRSIHAESTTREKRPKPNARLTHACAAEHAALQPGRCVKLTSFNVHTQCIADMTDVFLVVAVTHDACICMSFSRRSIVRTFPHTAVHCIPVEAAPLQTVVHATQLSLVWVTDQTPLDLADDAPHAFLTQVRPRGAFPALNAFVDALLHTHGLFLRPTAWTFRARAAFSSSRDVATAVSDLWVHDQDPATKTRLDALIAHDGPAARARTECIFHVDFDVFSPKDFSEFPPEVLQFFLFSHHVFLQRHTVVPHHAFILNQCRRNRYFSDAAHPGKPLLPSSHVHDALETMLQYTTHFSSDQLATSMRAREDHVPTHALFEAVYPTLTYAYLAANTSDGHTQKRLRIHASTTHLAHIHRPDPSPSCGWIVNKHVQDILVALHLMHHADAPSHTPSQTPSSPASSPASASSSPHAAWPDAIRSSRKRVFSEMAHAPRTTRATLLVVTEQQRATLRSVLQNVVHTKYSHLVSFVHHVAQSQFKAYEPFRRWMNDTKPCALVCTDADLVWLSAWLQQYGKHQSAWRLHRLIACHLDTVPGPPRQAQRCVQSLREAMTRTCVQRVWIAAHFDVRSPSFAATFYMHCVFLLFPTPARARTCHAKPLHRSHTPPFLGLSTATQLILLHLLLPHAH